MKTGSMTLFAAISFMLIYSGNNKAATTETQLATKTPSEKKISHSDDVNISADGILGNWKLRLEVFDDNGNRVPDEAELKKGYAKNYSLQLNADGTCRMQQMFTGRYQQVTEKGREMLKLYRNKMEGEADEPKPQIFQVTSVKKDELVLQIIIAGEPSSFWFFDRVK